jgi:4-hydroxy-tetrahydrodipicolinate synthase
MDSFDLNGMLPAAILPMTADYEPDYGAYTRYIEWLISENAIALAVNMDTGEGPQLTVEERRRVVETAAKVSNGRCPVVAGVMGSTTAGAVEMATVYKDAGADGLVIFPNAAFRNEPLDPRIPCSYHQAIASETGLPLILFQLAPVFGGVNYTRETLLRMLEIPEVVAIKEASFDPQYFAYTKETLDIAGREITLLTGNDRFITESILLGATGALLGFAAIGCGMVAQMLAAANSGDWKQVVDMRPCLHAFASAIYKDPVLDYRARCKAALAYIGVIERSQTYVRPPLLSVEDEEYAVIGKALVQAGMSPG